MTNTTKNPLHEETKAVIARFKAQYPSQYHTMLSAIEEERMYQNNIWNEDTTETKGFHTLPEWAVSIYEYTNEARAHISRNGEPYATELASNCLRKVAAMVLSAAEQHNFVDRLLELSSDDILTDVRNVNELLCYLQYPINKISEVFYNGANRDNPILEVLFGQIFIVIVDTISKTDTVVFRYPPESE